MFTGFFKIDHHMNMVIFYIKYACTHFNVLFKIGVYPTEVIYLFLLILSVVRTVNYTIQYVISLGILSHLR